MELSVAQHWSSSYLTGDGDGLYKLNLICPILLTVLTVYTYTYIPCVYIYVYDHDYMTMYIYMYILDWMW